MNKKYVLRAMILVILISLFISQTSFKGSTMTKLQPLTEKTIYDFIMKDIDGHDVKLEQYRGKVVLIVNVASKCGFTPQYAGLQKLYLKYKDQGLYVLGFPANNFLSQEPGTNEEIKNFCSINYDVTFPMFAKISVKGQDKHPLYRFLTEEATNPEFAGEISWNFNKFLVDRSGTIIARFGSKVKPEDEQLTTAIDKALKQTDATK
jgi:glutathione peroxidase